MKTTALKDSELMENPVLSQMAEYNHEQLLFCHDEATNLKAIIAVHNTVLGPALGGTRMWNYANEMEALNDVLRLSRGMTYKASISGLNLGGGKAVIFGDPNGVKDEAMFRRFGKFVQSLGGKYITAEDVGISPKEMQWVNMETAHVTGLPNKGGDPSPVTAWGVYWGMKAAAKKAYGTDSLSGKSVLVQGIGHVGEYLVKYLTEEGAKVLISDIYEPRLKHVAQTYNATVVPVEEVYKTRVDIYAPCALGATINDETLQTLDCDIIAGAANNQLAKEAVHGVQVEEKGMIYVPDYMLNAGGLINCYAEIHGMTIKESMDQAAKIYDTTTEIIRRSGEEGMPAYMISNQMAEERIKKIGKVKLPL